MRLLTYNVLLGGHGREDRIADLLLRSQADVIALQEASDLALVRRLAHRLEMRMAVGKPGDSGTLNLAVLTRLPLTRWRNHQHPGRMMRTHLECEVATGSAAMPHLRVHCVHLAARFGERANGEQRRMREVRAILGDIERSGRRTPHVLLGDFNAVAPGDIVAASGFFERMAELRRAGLVVRGLDGIVGPVVQQRDADRDPGVDDAWSRAGVHPHLDVGVPRLPAIVFPLTGVLPRHPVTDRILNLRIQRWTVRHLVDEGYVDCFRALHPRRAGYTCATWMPAARIDYVFAEQALARRLRLCDVVGGLDSEIADPDALTASDHFPVMADFHLA